MPFSRLADSIRLSCSLHSQRQLSIRGRATVLNSLIYSKLWHVLRLSCFTQSQLSSLHRIGLSFVNRRIFPRFAADHLHLPRSKGGLGVMSPSLQQMALQWRWLYPLLVSDSSSDSDSVAMTTLRFVFNHFLHSPTFSSYRFYLLFPDARRPLWFPHRLSTDKYFLDVTTNFVQAFDYLPRSFSHCTAHAAVCLSLPFLSVIDKSPGALSSTVSHVPLSDLLSLHPGLRNLLAVDIFRYDPLCQKIVLRERTSGFHRYRNLCMLAVSFISNGQMVLLPFFRVHMDHLTPFSSVRFPQDQFDLQPFCSAIISATDTSTMQNTLNSIRYYKSLLPSMPASSSIPASKWRRFWRIPMPLSARTVWYRAIHRKIPSRSLLNAIMPTIVDSSECAICSSVTSAIDSRSHFLWSCHLKLAVWRSVFNRFIFNVAHLSSGAFTDILESALLFARPLERYYLHDFTDLSAAQIFACTLLALWRAHWNVVFYSRPFLPAAVIASVHKSLSLLCAESNLDDPSHVQ